MAKQLVTIRPDGSVQSLDFKEKGLKLATLGRAVTRRISEVVWHDDEQLWYVTLCQGQLTGWHLSKDLVLTQTTPIDEEYADLPKESYPYAKTGEYLLLLFNSYSDAVTAEVSFIQAMRSLGKNHLVSDA